MGATAQIAAPPPVTPRKRRRRGFVIGSIAAGVLVLGALAGAGVIVFEQHHNAGASEAVTTAATKTLAAQSADMSMKMDISVLGHHESITGSGAFDFANQTGTFTANLPGRAGNQVTEQVLYDGKTVYVNVGSLLGNLGGLGNGLTQGKQWVSVDTSQFGSGSAGALGGGLDMFGNPAAMLQQLRSEGGTVTSLGATTYDGTAVTEYSVALPPSDTEKAMGELPTSVQHALSGVTPASIEAKVYVASGNLLKAIDLPISFSFMGQTMSEEMTMVFSNFGTPVSVTPPPANEVIPFSQFAGGLFGGSGLGNRGNSGSGNAGNSGNTGNSGNAGNSGNTGNSGSSGNSGNTGNSGNSAKGSGHSGNDSGDTGNTGLFPNAGNSGNTGSGSAI
jgi:hypothetical protein